MSQFSSQLSEKSPESYNEVFGKDNVQFSYGQGQLVSAELRRRSGAALDVQLHGAHATSWVDSTRKERLFMSDDAVYESDTPLRGGIPLIFPQFGPGEITSHGFVRRSHWHVLSTQTDADQTSLTLEITQDSLSPKYRREWPHAFRIQQEFVLTDTELKLVFKVTNTDTSAFHFTHGFHTYLQIHEINKTKVTGFSDLEYMDQLREHQQFTENRKEAVISEHTDRRYQNIPEVISIHDSSSGDTIYIKTENCSDAFFWNPWEDGEQGFKDLTPGSYKEFVCVEPGNMQHPISLAPGESFTAVQTLSV